MRGEVNKAENCPRFSNALSVSSPLILSFASGTSRKYFICETSLSFNRAEI